MTDELRIGFVGCGKHATNNLYPCLQYANARLVSVCDLDEELLARNKRNFGAEAGFTSYKDLLNGPEIDAVFVCGPPSLHHEVGIAALDAGYPVFMEKAPAMTLEGALEVREASRQNGKPCMVAFMKRFGTRYAEAKQITETEEFGELTQVNVKYSHVKGTDLAWMMLYMSVHPCDLFRFYLGDLARINFERVTVKGQCGFSIAALGKSGAVGTLVISSHEPRVKEHVELVGEGTLVVVNNLVELEYHKRLASPWIKAGLGQIDVVRPDFAVQTPDYSTLFLQGYAGEVIEFVDAIREHREPACTIHDGVMAMRMTNLFEHSEPGSYDVSDWD